MNVIMIVTNRFDPDVRVLKEAEYLTSKGYNVEILCWDRENEYLDKPVENINKVKVRRFFPYSKYGTGLKQINSFIKFIIECRKYLKHKEVHFIHMHDLDGAIVGIMAKCFKSKLVFDMHEIYELQTNSKILRLLIRLLVKLIQRKVDFIIYLNEYQIFKMNNKLRDKLVYLPNYPDKRNFINTNKNKSKKLRISYIGMVGKFEIFRNLFEACKDLDSVEISIHGSGIAYEKLKDIELNYNNVRVTGKYHFSQSSKLYNECDLLYAVYPMSSLQNRVAQPIKYFEAIITTTPIVVSRGMLLEKEVLDKNIGFVVNGEDVEDIKKLIMSILEDRSILEQRRKELDKIKEKYVWEEVVKNIDYIYFRS